MVGFLSNGATVIIAVLLVLAIAYRYYSAFIAAKMLALDPNRPTPAHTLRDGHNYHPTNKWVLFGHHFAAISGAGPLIGPVLAAQFGFLPGLLWILIGVCLAGAVQDFIVLGLSTRRNGKSLAQIAYMEISTPAGTAATIGILFVLVIALAGLGKVVTKALGGETIAYGPGTQFVASAEKPIVKGPAAGGTFTYHVPVGSKVLFPLADGKTVTRVSSSELVISAVAAGGGGDAVDIEAAGNTLVVPAGADGKAGHLAVVEVIAGSSWGTFTIFLTVPIAFMTGIYMYRIRKGRVVEASIIGGLLTLFAVYLGGRMNADDSILTPFRQWFNLTEGQVGYSMAIYGFVASVLPVWMLLCPRDYLSSFLKIGTIGLLIVGVIVAHPHLRAPALNFDFFGGGPVVTGAIFPFVFITIMCGAVSGFHALVASGTTPKMLNKETDARMIGYGAMLMEGLVGVVALMAASALPVAHYYEINTQVKDIPVYQATINKLAERDRASILSPQLDQVGGGTQAVAATVKAFKDEPLPDVGEHVQGRTGGAVTLALGMAHVLNSAVNNVIGNPTTPPAWLTGLFRYWYHFAIMFEALFILTTIDTGTRVGRFLLQETMGKWVHPKLAKTDWWPSAILATALMSGGWWYFLNFNGFSAIWAMFGIANQMLAVMALAIASAALARMGKRRYLAVTLAPMCFVAITTSSAAVLMLREYVMKIVGAKAGESVVNPVISAICVAAILACSVVVVGGALWTVYTKSATPEPAVPAAV